MKHFIFGFLACATLVATYSAIANPQVAKATKQPVRPSLEMTVESSLPFKETIEAIKMAAAAEKYGHQGTHPLSDILTSKGFPTKPLAIVEVCNPKAASDSIKNDPMAALMMPCPIMVWEKDGKVMVTTFDTRIMAQMYRGKTMPEVGSRVYKSLKSILSSVEKR